MADVVVVVATCSRFNLLSNVCLPSILQQTAVPSTVVVVDDSQVGLALHQVRCLHI
jgi:GT2 family glycosyltransferase